MVSISEYQHSEIDVTVRSWYYETVLELPILRYFGRSASEYVPDIIDVEL